MVGAVTAMDHLRLARIISTQRGRVVSFFEETKLGALIEVLIKVNELTIGTRRMIVIMEKQKKSAYQIVSYKLNALFTSTQRIFMQKSLLNTNNKCIVCYHFLILPHIK